MTESLRQAIVRRRVTRNLRGEAGGTRAPVESGFGAGPPRRPGGLYFAAVAAPPAA
jgi:hypothetical protein